MTSLYRICAVARHELLVVRRNPSGYLITVISPIGLVFFIKPTMDQLLGSGADEGAIQAVAGAAVLFNFWRVEGSGLSFFREYGWLTWPRLRASQLRASEVLLGKASAQTLLNIVQLCLVIGVIGVLVYNIDVAHLIWTLLVIVVVALSTVALGFALAVTTSTLSQFSAIANSVVPLIAVIGGALVPLRLLPGWAQAFAPAVPPYWSMRAFTNALSAQPHFQSLALSIGVLLLWSAVGAAVTLWRFSYDEDKFVASLA